MLGLALYYAQIALLGGCVLSLAQFGGEKMSFHEWYLARMGVRVSRRKLAIFLNGILPLAIVLLAVAVQVVLGVEPLVSLWRHP